MRAWQVTSLGDPAEALQLQDHESLRPERVRCA